MPMLDMVINQIMNDPKFKNNSTMQNAFRMYREGNSRGVEQLAHNVAQAQGRDINQLLSQIRK